MKLEGKEENSKLWGVQKPTKASNLFSAVTNGRFVSSATAEAIFTSNLDGKKQMITVKEQTCLDLNNS